MGRFEDPFGHHWIVATHIEDVAPEEMAQRAAEAMAAGESVGRLNQPATPQRGE